MRILVTGGAGFIGSHLCERLVASRHHVTCLDNYDPFYSRSRKEANLGHLLREKRFSYLECDVRRSLPLRQAVGSIRFDAVFHLAGRGGVPQSTQKPLLYLDETVRGTAALLEAVAHQARLFVYASSSSVYGETCGAKCRETRFADRPHSVYAAAKRAGELLCHAYHRLNGIGIVNVRFFSVYGPRGRPDQIVYKITRLIDENRPIPVVEPDPTRDFTYVDDIVDGLERMLDLPSSCYEVVNLGSGKPEKISGLIERVEHALGRKARFGPIGKAPPSDISSTYADISYARLLLGWQPRTSLTEGVQRFVEWYRRTQR